MDAILEQKRLKFSKEFCEIRWLLMFSYIAEAVNDQGKQLDMYVAMAIMRTYNDISSIIVMHLQCCPLGARKGHLTSCTPILVLLQSFSEPNEKCDCVLTH